jgi:hypothetical protein
VYYFPVYYSTWQIISTFENFRQFFCMSCSYSLPATFSLISPPPPPNLVCIVIFGKYPKQIIKLQIDHLFSIFRLVGQSQKRTEFEYRYLWQRSTCFITLKQLLTFVTVVSSCAFHLCVGNTNIVGKTLYHLANSYRVLEDCGASTIRFQAV